MKRACGYRRALEEAGLQYDESNIFETMVDYDGGVAAADMIVNSKSEFTAIVTTADALAIGLMKGFSSKGISVPKDYSIIGFDDLDISRYLPVGLTTVKQDISLKGEQAVEILIKSASNQDYERQDIVMPTQIVERESVIRRK